MRILRALTHSQPIQAARFASLSRPPPPLKLARATFATTAPRKMKVIPVPVREDNYAYLLIDDASNKAAAVDPYNVDKVREAADKAGVDIVAAITTHHHFDHSGGNQVCLCPTPPCSLLTSILTGHVHTGIRACSSIFWRCAIVEALTLRVRRASPGRCIPKCAHLRRQR